MKQIDTGRLSFQELRNEDMFYVDKTLLIKDILTENKRGVYLFTRPRRFGKTTNLTMLDAFFNIKYKGNTWFDGLAISQHPEFDEYKNAFPVVFINLKDVKENDYDSFLILFRELVVELFNDFDYLWESPEISPDEKKYFKDLNAGTLPSVLLKISIKKLTGALERYHKKKVIVLIDEYDRAVSDAFGEESHRPMLNFLGEFMGATLKNNDSLQMAYITGVMQIAKESIFSGLNNLKVNNIFSKMSDERFGFTEKEVKEIFAYYEHSDKFEEAKQWYDGYCFGNAEVYNPFSIMNYVSSDFEPEAYWTNSGGSWIIRYLLERIDSDNIERVSKLVSGESFEFELSPTLTFARIGSSEVALYSLMAMAGYLKAVPQGDGGYLVSIPNKEVQGIVGSTIKSLNSLSNKDFLDFNRAILDHDARKMTSVLERILLSGSYLNLSIENGYGLVLMTIMYPMVNKYEVKTEYDAGNGRADIILRPRSEKGPPIVMELKSVKSERGLDKGVQEAFKQIHDKKYYAGMKGEVILIGIAFFVKTSKVRIETIDNGDGFAYSGIPQRCKNVRF